jgi:Mg/Co/Ni transporter MgtE
LPTEGIGPFYLVVDKNVRPPTVTCRPDMLAGQIRSELEPGPDSICAVTNVEGIVLGRVRWTDLPADDDVRAEEFMVLGPATVRPAGEGLGLVDRMRKAGVTTILVTTPKGRLVGTLYRDDAERLIRERPVRSDASGEDVS